MEQAITGKDKVVGTCYKLQVTVVKTCNLNQKCSTISDLAAV